MTDESPRIRLTSTTMLVLDALANAGDDPLWGYRISELTGLGSGTVYPILERLERAGYIEGTWETGQPEDRPRRRLYTITGAGRARRAEKIAGRKRPSMGLQRLWRPT